MRDAGQSLDARVVRAGWELLGRGRWREPSSVDIGGISGTGNGSVNLLRLYWLCWGTALAALLATFAADRWLPGSDANGLSPWAVPFIPVALVAAFIGLVAIRCPQCGLALSWRHSSLTRGIPGRLCPRCGTDLTKRTATPPN